MTADTDRRQDAEQRYRDRPRSTMPTTRIDDSKGTRSRSGQDDHLILVAVVSSVPNSLSTVACEAEPGNRSRLDSAARHHPSKRMNLAGPTQRRRPEPSVDPVCPGSIHLGGASEGRVNGPRPDPWSGLGTLLSFRSPYRLRRLRFALASPSPPSARAPSARHSRTWR